MMFRTEIVDISEAMLGQIAQASGDQNVLFKCPFHEGGKHRGMTFSVNIYHGASHCFSERCGVSFKSLKALAYALGKQDDLRLLEDLSKIQTVRVETGLTKMEELPEEILALMEDAYDKLPTFSREVLDAFEVRYDEDANLIVYPLRDSAGRLVRIHCRTLDPHSFLRYRFFTNDDYRRFGVELSDDQLGKGHNFLNGHRVINRVLNDELDQVVVVEGPKQAMRVYEAGYRQVIATMGGFGPQQLSVLQMLACHFYTFFDNDEGGEGAREKFYKRMVGCNRVTHIDYGATTKRQPDELTINEIRTLFRVQGVRSTQLKENP